MVIYSVSVRIKKEVEDEWLSWMKETHIPAVLNTKYFNSCQMYRVLVPEVKENYVIYKMKYECNSIDQYNEYSQKEASRLQLQHNKKYQGKFSASREVMEKI